MAPQLVIWITGLAGSGKTTLATALVNSLRRRGLPAVLVDGDEVRRVVSDQQTGYDIESRVRNAQRVSLTAQWLESQGLTVVVSTISLFHSVQDWNRQHFKALFEVLLEAPLEHLRQTHPDQLYQQVENVMGQDQQPEFPRRPHLRWSNDEPPDSFVRKCLGALEGDIHNWSTIQTLPDLQAPQRQPTKTKLGGAPDRHLENGA